MRIEEAQQPAPDRGDGASATADSSSASHTAGAPRQSGPASARQLGGELEELIEYASYYLAARVDRARLLARRLAIYCVLAMLGAMVLATYAVMATASLVLGIAHGLAQLLGDRLWLGYLTAGFLLWAAPAAALYFGLRQWTIRSRERTVDNYARRRQQQTARFGRRVGDR
jgi:hypothetical protein